MADEHTLGLLREGTPSDTIVSDAAVPGGPTQKHEWLSYYGGHLVAESITTVNRRRLIACWNACDGIPSALLTGGETLAHYTGQVIAQRDGLLAALERAERKLTAYVGVCTGDKELTDAVLPMARAAIAKATGSAA
jgi:hypothetical protein